MQEERERDEKDETDETEWGIAGKQRDKGERMSKYILLLFIKTLSAHTENARNMQDGPKAVCEAVSDYVRCTVLLYNMIPETHRVCVGARRKS